MTNGISLIVKNIEIRLEMIYYKKKIDYEIKKISHTENFRNSSISQQSTFTVNHSTLQEHNRLDSWTYFKQNESIPSNKKWFINTHL